MGQVGHKTSPKNGGKISKKSVICKKDGANSPFGSGWTPSPPVHDVADESGFSSRTTFFRNFKALTGVTPQEWKNKV